MSIPVLNIYFMLLYAWDVLDEADVLDVRADDCTTYVDLFARVLHSGTDMLLRRGLDRGYVAHHEMIAGVRGKLEISDSIKTSAFGNAQAVCEFDELTHDVLHNRILATTISQLLRLSDLSPTVHEQLAESYYRLRQIPPMRLSASSFRAVQLHKNNRQYKLLMGICRLIHSAKLPTEQSGETQFRDFLRDERRMRTLFEKFVRNFFRREQRRFAVRRTKMRFAPVEASDQDRRFLPMLETDTTLLSSEEVRVVETKFTSEALATYLGDAKLRSAHLYQMLAYLHNISSHRQAHGKAVSGILLYPTAEHVVDLRFKIQGFPIRVFTLDLSRDWTKIRHDLLQLLDPQLNAS